MNSGRTLHLLALFAISLFANSACSHGARNQTAGFMIASVQYPIEGNHSPEMLLKKVEGYVREARNSGAELVVFPELITLDAWPMKSKSTEGEIAGTIADQITPKLFEAVPHLSRKHQIAILAGSSPRRVEGQIRNTSLLAFPDGRKVMQDKVFLTDWERALGWKPGNEIRVFDSPWGRSVILICYDVEFPMIAQALVASSPEVILVPSMTESRSGLQRVRWTTQARAVELHSYAVISGTVGRPSKSWVHHGQSAFITPRDSLFPEHADEGKVGEKGITTGRVDLPRLRESRKKSKFIPARDQEGRKIKVVVERQES